MQRAGIVATTPGAAALRFRAFCQDGFAELGPHDHPDVTLDCIALARSLPAWQAGNYATMRATLSVSAGRLAAAGAISLCARTTPPTSRYNSQGPAFRSPAHTALHRRKPCAI